MSAHPKRGVYHLSNAACNHELNGLFRLGPMSVEHDGVTDRVRAEMAARRKTVGDLATFLGYSAQRVNNWFNARDRDGIPRAEYHGVARFLGWSVDRLMGQPDHSQPKSWPFDTVPESRFLALPPSDRMRVEAAMMDELERVEATRREKNGGGKRPPRAANSHRR